MNIQTRTYNDKLTGQVHGTTRDGRTLCGYEASERNELVKVNKPVTCKTCLKCAEQFKQQVRADAADLFVTRRDAMRSAIQALKERARGQSDTWDASTLADRVGARAWRAVTVILK